MFICPPGAMPGAGAPMAAMGNATCTVLPLSTLNVASSDLPACSGCFEADEHHVKASRLERDGLARLDLKAALHRPHFHYAAVHGHLVDLAFGGGIARHAVEVLGCGAAVRYRHIGGASTCAFRRGARPGLGDLD